MSTTTPTAFVAEIQDPKTGTRTQVIATLSGTVFRRALAEGQKRTHWRAGKVTTVAQWLRNFVAMSEKVNGSTVSFATLIELTDEEASEADNGDLPRNVGLRFDRARKHSLGSD